MPFKPFGLEIVNIASLQHSKSRSRIVKFAGETQIKDLKLFDKS